MTEEYSTYLHSEAWQRKRAQRLAISQYRCAACTDRRAIDVHHLTYARIFNEDMEDLLPLCRVHHDVAEELIHGGKLPRSGDVLFLATETVRLICETKQRLPVITPAEYTPSEPRHKLSKRQARKLRKQERLALKRQQKKEYAIGVPRKAEMREQLMLMTDFTPLLRLVSRREFIKECRVMFPEAGKSIYVANAIILYDNYKGVRNRI